jgi:hypothetical protein
VIRRHLGGHWRALPVETDILLRVMAVQLGIIALTLLIPGLFILMFMVLPVSLVLLPIVFLMYARMLGNIGRFTVEMIVSEKANSTFELLRVTPMSLTHILYSKAAAGVWRYVEDFGLIIIGGALLWTLAASAPVSPRIVRTLEYLLKVRFTRKLAHIESASPGPINRKYIGSKNIAASPPRKRESVPFYRAGASGLETTKDAWHEAHEARHGADRPVRTVGSTRPDGIHRSGGPPRHAR